MICGHRIAIGESQFLGSGRGRKFHGQGYPIKFYPIRSLRYHVNVIAGDNRDGKKADDQDTNYETFQPSLLAYCLHLFRKADWLWIQPPLNNIRVKGFALLRALVG